MDMALRGLLFLALAALPEDSERSGGGREGPEKSGTSIRLVIPISSLNAQFEDGPATDGSDDVETRRGLVLGVVFPGASVLSSYEVVSQADSVVSSSGVVAMGFEDLDGT